MRLVYGVILDPTCEAKHLLGDGQAVLERAIQGEDVQLALHTDTRHWPE
jgi:hypothetical protein